MQRPLYAFTPKCHGQSGGGGHFTKYLVGGPAHNEKMDPIGCKVFLKLAFFKRSKNNEKGSQKELKIKEKFGTK